MSNPILNDELDGLIWHALRDRDGHPAKSSGCCPPSNADP